MKAKKLVILLVVFSLPAVLFLSCSSFGAAMQTAASVGQGLGISSREFDLIASYAKTFEEITPEQEYYIGRAVAANVLTAYKIQTNMPAETSYVNRICNALVIHSARPEIFNGYRVAILDSDEINAFATPGGHIFITRSLLECASSEDTLAAVISHEVAHIQLEHGLKAIKSSRRAEAFSNTLSYAADVTAKDSRFPELVNTFSNGIDEIVTNMMTKGYSRAQEREADSAAMNLLALTGYEPSSLIDMLRVLEKEQPGKRGGFNDTHPTPAQRISSVSGDVKNYNVPDTRSYRQARYIAVR